MMNHLDTIQHSIKNGSVITVDKGIVTLSKLAAVREDYHAMIFPFLLRHLECCRSKDVPQHSESVLPAVTANHKEDFLKVLRGREQHLTEAQLKRVHKLYKALTD